MAKTKAPAVEKTATATPTDENKNVVKGEDPNHGDVFAQARKARGEDGDATDGGKDKESGKAVSLSKQAAEADYTDAMKKADLAKEAREEHLKANGIEPNSTSSVSGGKKVVASDIKGEQYVGPVTCTSVHGQTHEMISAKIDLPAPSGEEFVWYAFKQHHPNAIRSEFVIDAKNEDDPNLRSRFE